MSVKQKGFFDKFLTLDCETTGMAIGSSDPSYDYKSKKCYQAISWGFVVVDTATLKPIDKLYVEFQWDGVSTWTPEAEAVHKLSKQYLAENGVNEIEGIETILSFLEHHFGDLTEVNIVCAGHNVASFDIWFLRRLLNKHDVMFRVSHRFIDTNALGFAVFNTYTSDQVFEMMGVQRLSHHNALDDALASLKVIQVARKIGSKVLG